MKVLLISQHAEPSDGWGTLTRTTALGLKHRGHDVHLLLQKQAQDLDVAQTATLPSPLVLLDYPLATAYVSYRIWQAVRSFQPDIIHVLTEPYALAMPFVPGRHPWVLTGCGTYTILPFLGRITGKLLQRVYADVDYVLAISDYTHQRILAELQQRALALHEAVAQKISVYTLGIEWPQQLLKRRSHSKKRVVFVGGVKERKGVREIVEACGVLKQQHNVPFQLDIIGSCPDNTYTQTLRQRVAVLDLSNEVVFRGHVSATALLQAYADADLFVMLSIAHEMHFEGYGLVFLEANAFGVPVIGPNDSGCTNAIAHGQSGYCINPNDPEAVAQAMHSILQESAISKDACITWAREHSVGRQAEETEQIYAEVLRPKAA